MAVRYCCGRWSQWIDLWACFAADREVLGQVGDDDGNQKHPKEAYKEGGGQSGMIAVFY